MNRRWWILLLTGIMLALARPAHVPSAVMAAEDPSIGREYGDNPSENMKPYWLKKVKPLTGENIFRIITGEEKKNIPLEGDYPTWEQAGFTITEVTLPTDLDMSFVKPIQVALKNLGFSPENDCGGYYGWYTEESMAKFQKSQGLPATGWPDRKTVAALNRLAGTDINLTTGEEFAMSLKAMLTYLKFYDGKIDGNFSPDLKKAVERYQRARGIRAGGIYYGKFEIHYGWVDSRTAEALNKEFREKQDSIPESSE